MNILWVQLTAGHFKEFSFGYIVDLDGNIRDSASHSIVPKYSVSKEIRDLAQKSLD